TQWAGEYATTAAAKRGTMLHSPTDALPANPIPRPPAASTSSEPTATTTAWLITHPVRERLVDSTGSARPATSSDRGRDPAITTYAATITAMTAAMTAPNVVIRSTEVVAVNMRSRMSEPASIESMSLRNAPYMAPMTRLAADQPRIAPR